MKKIKINLILSVTGLLMIVAFCTKDNYMSDGTILGPDVRMCACCGGWYIKIDTTTYEFESLPDKSGIDLQTVVFPINVKLDWRFSERTACPDRFISILRIIKE